MTKLGQDMGLWLALCSLSASALAAGQDSGNAVPSLVHPVAAPSDAQAATQTNVEQRVMKLVAEQLGEALSKVHLTSRFVEDLDADSLDVVELIMALEEEFALEILDADAQRIATVGEAVRYVQIRLAKATAKKPKRRAP